MDYLSRDVIISEMNSSLREMMEKYQLDDIGIFEEQGEGNLYYVGYTIRKDGKVYMIHHPFVKNEEEELAPVNDEWIIEADEGDTRGYQNLDEVFSYIEGDINH